jgi:RNA polymerase sigma-70 factor (ECF subfamily)
MVDHRPDMTPGRRAHAPQLKLVTSTDVTSTDRGGTTRPRDPGGRPRDSDWSALMARAQDGDRQAYRVLLEDVTPFLRTLALRCFREAGDIEDAVQDVLLAIHAVRHAYDPRRPFGPWLVAIANRRIIDRLRRHLRERSREITMTPEHETFWAGQTNLASGSEEPAVEEEALRDAIGKLSPDQQQAIRLLKIRELSLKEAALASGRSVAALKVATHRAIKSRRKLLQRSDGKP